MADNVRIIRGLYEAFGKGDVGAVLAAFDDQIQWLEAEGFTYAEGNPYVGPAAVATGVFQPIVNDVENFTVTAASYVDGGDTIVAEGRYTGRVKATGVPVDAQFAHVWRLRDGKIIGFQQYTDTRQWMAATTAAAQGV